MIFERAVRGRDGDQCTFVSAAGHRCEATAFLEYDHIVPVCQGGPSTVESLRLRCSTHNRYTARQQGLIHHAREAATIYRATPLSAPTGAEVEACFASECSSVCDGVSHSL